MREVISVAEVAEHLKAIGAGVKQSALLSGSWQGDYAVAAIVIDGIRPPAEIHKERADIWIVLSGSAEFVVGGGLENASETASGEIAGESIAGGEVKRVSAGDIIDIPAGVAHQVDARGGRAEFLIVKIHQHGA